ncbi:MAG: response regulator, partial [Bacteroidota bacterium]
IIGIHLAQKGGGIELLFWDTGAGIPPEDIPYIFDRFYRVAHSNESVEAGTGIGLAHTKALVNLLGGHIQVQSKLGEGSHFTICLPITNNATLTETSLLKEGSFSPTFESPSLEREEAIEPHQPQVLVVEDNKDVRRYLSKMLADQFQIKEATDGFIGFEMAKEHIPDLIITDIMMPHQNGFELLKKLKTESSTSFIPVIVVSAKANRDSRLESLGLGAEAFLEKPFDQAELLIRIQQLIQQRKEMQLALNNRTTLSPATPYSQEQQLLNTLDQFIYQHFEDESFDVMKLCQLMGMSRSKLYRIIKALTDRSIASYIRFVRLKAGKALLESSELNVSQVAFKVGFKDLSYFSSSFSNEFGHSPKVYLRN